MQIQKADAGMGQPYPASPSAAPAAVDPAAAVTQQADATQPAPAAVDRTAVVQAVDQTNKMIQPIAKDLQFSVDPDTKVTVVKLVDTATQQVLRQVPSEEMLAIAKALDQLQGLLVKQTA